MIHKFKFIVILIIFFYSNSLVAQNKTVETTGDILLIALPSTAMATTLIKGDKKGTWQLSKGFVLNAAVTYTLKKIVKKQRPDLSDYDSFPSGHTSIAFQSAAFMQQRYGWKIGIPFYALASFTAYSRVEAKKHEVSDVIVGAIIGAGSSYLFTTPYQKEHYEITFNSDDKGYLLGFKYTF